MLTKLRNTIVRRKADTAARKVRDEHMAMLDADLDRARAQHRPTKHIHAKRMAYTHGALKRG